MPGVRGTDARTSNVCANETVDAKCNVYGIHSAAWVGEDEHGEVRTLTAEHRSEFAATRLPKHRRRSLHPFVDRCKVSPSESHLFADPLLSM